jgi:hypothetical protein
MIKQSEKGFILPITMIMIVTMTILTLSLMQSIFVYLKLIHQIEKKHTDFYELESTVLILAELLKTQERSECIMNTMDPNQIIEMLRQHQGCPYIHKNRSYEYLIDDLGIHPCIKIISKQTPYGSHHWLLTVRAASSRSPILQIRLASPDKVVSCQVMDERFITSGVTSWRYVSG